MLQTFVSIFYRNSGSCYFAENQHIALRFYSEDKTRQLKVEIYRASSFFMAR